MPSKNAFWFLIGCDLPCHDPSRVLAVVLLTLQPGPKILGGDPDHAFPQPDGTDVVSSPPAAVEKRPEFDSEQFRGGLGGDHVLRGPLHLAAAIAGQRT